VIAVFGKLCPPLGELGGGDRHGRDSARRV
jgi:hypothetical protein